IIDATDATSYTRDDTPGSFDGCEYFIRAWDGANASESAYTICWKDASSSSAMVTTAQVQQVNGERVMITYSLSSAADISVGIRNIAGRMVRQIPCGTETAGVNSTTWNLRNTSGAKVPHGTYLCTITARSDDGTQATAVRTMQITR
ncbi:MAG: FlgD immunoglobulin-like domain containing protein, partial [Armatimonadota bacterium]